MKSLDKILLFYNPNSGNRVFPTHLDKIVERFQKKKQLIVPVRAERSDILTRFFNLIDFHEYKKIIIAGGDGTINTVVNAMIKNNVDIPLSIFPTGTANDFAYYFDLPADINELLKISTDEFYTYSDVGMAGDKAFVNVMALGMLVDISQKTDPVAKNTLGVVSYYLKGMAEIPKMKSLHIKITTDKETIETDMLFMLIMNGRSAGGFNHIAPKAEINDGLFDVVLIKSIPLVELPNLFFSVMSGQHYDHKNVIYFKTSHLKLESKDKIISDVDGETGPELPANVDIIHNRLKINTFTDNITRNVW